MGGGSCLESSRVCVPLSLQDAWEGRAELEHGRLAAGALPGLDPPGLGFPAASSSHRFGGVGGFPSYLENQTPPQPVPQQPVSEAESRGSGSSVLHRGNSSPLYCSSLKKAWAEPWLTFPCRPEDVVHGERPVGGGLSLASWPNSVLFFRDG